MLVAALTAAVALVVASVGPVGAQSDPSSTTSAPPSTPPPTASTTSSAPAAPPPTPAPGPPEPRPSVPASPPPLAESAPSTTRPAGATGSTRAPRTPTTSTPARDAPVAPVVVVDDPRVLPELGAVGLDSPEYNLAVAAYVEAQSRLDEQVRDYDRAVTSLRDLAGAETRLRGDVAQATRRLAKATTRLDQLRTGLRDLAVDQYVQGGLAGPPEESLDLGGTTEQARRRVLVDAVQGERLAELGALSEAVRVADATITSTRAELDDLQRRRRDDEATRDRAAAERDRLTVEVALRRRAVADTRLLAAVVGLDFPLVVLNAYVTAAKVLAVTQPECGIRWQALAGIGRTESRHGTFGDSAVDADGNVSPPIVGIPLDGSNGTAAIGDTDLGLLDGDPNVDRAAGPMQFIPSTWVKFARDGNGDGRVDPQNMYDAALAAAVYLCRQGPGLDADEGLRRAFLSYNNDGSYAALVLDRTHGYDEFVIPAVPGAPVLPPQRPRPVTPADAPPTSADGPLASSTSSSTTSTTPPGSG